VTGRAGSAAYRQLALVAVVQVLAMSVWFATAAVVPMLTSDWRISTAAASWLTTSVQLGFATGAVASALLNLADRVRVPTLMTAGSLGAATTTLLLPVLAHGLAVALPLRFLDRRRARARLSARRQARDVVVRRTARPADRNPDRRVDAGLLDASARERARFDARESHALLAC